jgi:S1-C subfamily serine protease
MLESLKAIHNKLGSELFNGDRLRLLLAVLLAVSPILLIVTAYTMGKKQHPSQVTVMVTNYSGSAGGSGVVIEHNANRSLVLTNGHVCGLVEKNGGLIKHDSGDYFVTGTMVSTQHDLCVISVAGDLKNSVKIAGEAPNLYSEAVVTGHPALLPNIISKGHFGNKQIVRVLIGIKPCTEEDMRNPNNITMCIFLGGFPIVKTFESQIVSALIQAGSSGSAVLNSDGELSGLVFAGAGDGLSYASIVPYQYIIAFLYGEFNTNKLVRPTNEIVLSPNQNQQNRINSIHEAIKKCKSNNGVTSELKEICKILRNDTMYRAD